MRKLIGDGGTEFIGEGHGGISEGWGGTRDSGTQFISDGSTETIITPEGTRD